MSTYYDVLGISKISSPKEVRQAYRKLARQYHPDVNPGIKDAEQKFKTITTAYEVLSNPDSRKKYDQYGDSWKYAERIPPNNSQVFQDFSRASSWQWIASGSHSGSSFDLGDFPDQFFSRSRNNRSRSSTTVPITMTLEEAYKGTNRVIDIPADAENSSTRKLEVKIPPGVDTGSKVRISKVPGPLSNVRLKITIRPHPYMRRKGADLYTDISVPLADAVLGSEVTVPTIDGQVALILKPETQNLQLIRLTGKGMPHLNNPSLNGDLFARIEVVLPKNLNEREREMFKELKNPSY